MGGRDGEREREREREREMQFENSSKWHVDIPPLKIISLDVYM